MYGHDIIIEQYCVNILCTSNHKCSALRFDISKRNYIGMRIYRRQVFLSDKSIANCHHHHLMQKSVCNETK